MSKIVLIGKADSVELELRMVWGEVYAPDRPDSQGEFMREDTIRKMAWEFIRTGKQTQIDFMHDNEVVDSRKLAIVESFIARKGDPDFIEGAWVVGMHIPDDQFWQKVKKGQINGFSLEAMVSRHTQDVLVDIPPVITGKTSKSDGHEHEFMVEYDTKGNFVGGKTNFVSGHLHEIVAGTHTQTSKGHSHRFSSVDAIKIDPVVR